MDEKRKKPMGELLVEEKIIDEHQLKAALAYQRKWGGRLGTVLVSLRFITEEKLLKFLSTHFQMPMINFEKTTIPPTVINSVPQEIAEKFNLIPLAIRTEAGRPHIFVVMSDPTNLEAIDAVQFKTGMKVKPVLAYDSAIAQAIKDYYEGTPQAVPIPPAEESIALEDEIQKSGGLVHLQEATHEAVEEATGKHDTPEPPAPPQKPAPSPAEKEDEAEEDMIIFAGGKEHRMSIANTEEVALEEEIPPEPEPAEEDALEELEPVEEEAETTEDRPSEPKARPDDRPPPAPEPESPAEIHSTKGDKLAKALTEILIEKNLITLDELKKKLKL